MLLAVLLLAACAPSVQTPVIQYQASASDILAALAVYGPTVKTGSGVEYFQVTDIGPDRITLFAEGTIGSQLFLGLNGYSITFTTLENNGITFVAYRIDGLNYADEVAKIFFDHLDTKFKRL